KGPIVTMCDNSPCTTSGIAEAEVRATFERQSDAILGCYRRHGAKGRGEVVLDLAIAHSAVHDAVGRGLGGTGPCIAHIAAKLGFASGSATVRFTFAFR